MKNLKLISIMLILSASVSAQNKLIDFSVIGGFGNPVASFTIKNGLAMHMGGEGAVVFANNLFVGGFGMETSSINNHKKTGTTPSCISTPKFPEYNIESEYGGLWLGYIVGLNKRVYINISGKVGSGKVMLNNRDLNTMVYDKVSIIKPQLSADIKLLSILAVTVGGGYTHFGNAAIQGYGANSFNSTEFFAGIKMGWW